MKRKPTITAILAAGLAFTAAFGAPRYSRIVSTARSFEQHLRAMESTSGSLGPVERFVYSLVLANSGDVETGKQAPPATPRT